MTQNEMTAEPPPGRPTDDLFRQDSYLTECPAIVVAAGPDGVMLDRSVFYPLGGGQPGDVGEFLLADGRVIPVIDTVKGPAPGQVLHRLAPDSPLPAVGDSLTARIDWPRRHKLMRMHSCLHLLTALIPGGVTGGQVAEGKGRLDFDLGDAAAPDKQDLTERLNALIAGDHEVRTRWISDAELDANPQLVKTMSVQPPRGQGRIRLLEVVDVDLQPCGGTHVRRTGEIGVVTVEKIESKGKRNRRITLAFA